MMYRWLIISLSCGILSSVLDLKCNSLLSVKPAVTFVQDAASILAEDTLKLPCKRFPNGLCNYGDDCRFSHMTPERRQQLEQQIERDKAAKQAKEKDKSLEMEPSLEDWLAKRAKRLKKDETVEEQIEPVQYQLPPFLMNIPSLPPSLLPPTLEDLKNTALCDWG